MAIVDADNLEFCTDCVMLIANGEVFDADGGDITNNVNACQVSIWGSGVNGAFGLVLDGNSTEDGGDYEPWFSWNACDGCGSTLGGDRYQGAHITTVAGADTHNEHNDYTMNDAGY